MKLEDPNAASDFERQASLGPSLAKSQALAFDADRTRAEARRERGPPLLQLHLFRN